MGGVTPAHFWSLVALSNLVLQELHLTENTNKGYIAHDRGITRIKSLMLDSGITLSCKIMAKFPHLTVLYVQIYTSILLYCVVLLCACNDCWLFRYNLLVVSL